MIKAVFFDMDGTILDTAEDLARAVNYAMGAAGHRHDYTKADACLLFGSGVQVAIRRALAIERGVDREALGVIGTPEEGEISPELAAETERIRVLYAPYYNAHCEEHTGPFAGIPEAIAALRSRGIRTAVVSNKPDSAAQILSKKYFAGAFDLSIGERPTVRRKPAPDALLACMRALNAAPEESVYIGDTEIDLQTAANAGIPCIAVTWGFRPEAELRAGGALHIAHTAEEMLRAILALG